jgi:hypothetical protein
MPLPTGSQHSMSLPVTFRFVFLEHCPRSHFLGPITIASGPLRTFLYMFVFPLLFCAHTAKMFSFRHRLLAHNIFSSLTIGFLFVLLQYPKFLST